MILPLRTPTVFQLYRHLTHQPAIQKWSVSSTFFHRHIMTSPQTYQSHMVGVVQLTSTPDKEANFATASSLIEKASKLGAQMVFLPEAFDIIGSNRQETMAAGEPLDGPTMKLYKQLAQTHQVWLSLGGFHEKPDYTSDPRLYNTHVILDTSGAIQGTYRKTHLFNVDIQGGARLKESDYTIPGSQIGPPVKTPVGNVGMAICYDMRFPELSIALRNQGAEILTFPSAFTVTTGLAHWESLLRSRAIETQCYVIAAAQVGKHTEKRASYGHTMVVDPWGCVVAECSDKIGLCMAEIDLTYLKRRQTEMPVQDHRRHDLYGHIELHQPVAIDSQPEYTFGQHQVKSTHIFYRTGLSYAVVNKKPVLPGHVLVCPIRCAQFFSDLTPAEVSDVFNTAQKVAKVLKAHYGTTSMQLAVQDGPDAGQTVKHLHVHLLPRRPGDFEENDDIYEKLEKHDKDVEDSKWRDDNEMTEEATILRPLFL